MSRLAVTHTTTYRYSEPVAVSHNVLHLAPRDGYRQKLLGFALEIEPAPAVAHQREDYFGNRVDFFTVQDQHHELTVRTRSEVEIVPAASCDPLATPAWEEVRDRLRAAVDAESAGVAEYLYDSPQIAADPQFADFAAAAFTPGRPLLAAAVDLTMRIFSGFAYDQKATAIGTPTMQVLRQRRGVCQDFAHLAIACLRSLGLAARYVSGYLETTPADGAPSIGADASHAWLAVFCPGHGWIDLDPTNGCLPGDRYVAVAYGRDFTDVSPIKGMILGGGNHSVSVGVKVERI